MKEMCCRRTKNKYLLVFLLLIKFQSSFFSKKQFPNKKLSIYIDMTKDGCNIHVKFDDSNICIIFLPSLFCFSFEFVSIFTTIVTLLFSYIFLYRYIAISLHDCHRCSSSNYCTYNFQIYRGKAKEKKETKSPRKMKKCRKGLQQEL